MKLQFVLLALVTGCATAVGSENGDAGTSASKDSGASKDAGVAKKDASPSQQGDDASVTQPQDDAGNTIDDSTCAAQTTKASCEQCCLTVHPSGYQVYQQELVSCACQTPAACATECATELCASKPTTKGGACETCITAALTQGGACYDGVANACQSDSDCTTLFSTCIPPCESK